ncbi:MULTISPECIES: VOC family protein [unclassified Imperialibacter]|uniref:bleomycin resistance protein n=1 Tax=unclassified Imperialibacter TaxID=2629706 RepID=UPI00125B511B|nr:MULTISPECIES: VOC family protein [unclassified Imperialibacter]CAD5250571.1 Glyoxalase/bleomycin resistance/extradiol dioxygenase family protein [Imperialibacter sp. 75]CAD5286516.1 Glyoxalase/bleomycin resistance/extradiol dioxygenase family protein [Imperialibacter sp. 89]VVT05612.1 Glyoxalase/bleomycin resistance/extradiol dioxygenase family protein [Imperialibacter sp. EC-SDR9]
MLTSVVPKLPFINKQETVNFYVNQLGFTLRSDYGDYLIMDKDGVELHFFSFPTIVPAKSDFMIYVRVDSDIESLFEKCRQGSSAVKIISRLESKPWGQKEFAIADPNGTCLTFGEAYS